MSRIDPDQYAAEGVELQMRVAEAHDHEYQGPMFTPRIAKGWYLRGYISFEEFCRAVDIALERGWDDA